jgi:outer membrane receptor for monomeric catechols
VGTYFDRKLTLLAGWREDEASTNQRSHVDYTPTGDINSYRYFTKDRKHRSRSAGATYFPFRPLGLYFNYAEGFLPIQNESIWVGRRGEVNFTVSKSKSLGLRFKVGENLLVGSLGFYTTDEGDRQTTVSKTEINRIWTNLATSRPALLDNVIGGPFSSFNDTMDFSAHGWEADLVMNVTKQLRLMANFALPKTKQDNANPDLLEYYGRNLAQWQGGLTDPLLTTAQKTSIQNDLTTILGLVNGAVNGRTINGTNKYRANLFANYTFAAEQFKGLSIGAGVNLFGQQLIGNAPASGFDYIYTDAYNLFMAKVGYAFKFRRLPFSLQLTANNLLNHQDPVYRNVATVGNVTYRNNYIYVEPRTINLNLNIKF